MKTCLFYAVGKSENQLLAYDEYADDSGLYLTDDVFMCERYVLREAKKQISADTPNIYLVSLTKKEASLPPEFSVRLCEGNERS